MRKISILYVYYNVPDEIRESIKSIKHVIDGFSYEIIIVDNNSPKELPEIREKDLTVIRNKTNKGFGKAVNQAARKASGEYLAIINPDTVLYRNSLSKLIEMLEKNTKIGVVGPKMVNPKGETLPTISGKPLLPGALIAFSFINKLFPKNKLSKNYWLTNIDRKKTQSVDTIGGACLVIRRDLFAKLKGFDERFFMYFEEADLCLRIKSLGYDVVYYPKAKILHLVGRSVTDKDWIRKKYQESRFKFFRKYHGLPAALLSEFFLRFVNIQTVILFIIIGISAFINLNRIDSNMLFIGDVGRDYLASRDMILTKQIPLVGIKSSVVWLHQGPLSIYIIGLALLVGRFDPVAPAIAYGLLGVLSTALAYIIGKTFFNRGIGLMAALFYATSPIVAINTRMPYHTSSIPLFASIFFVLLYKVQRGKKKYILPLFISMGLLLQLELSNVVLISLLLLLFFIKRKMFVIKDALYGAVGLLIGILPFILYDFTHHFSQTIGFALWVANRIRLFLGLTTQGNSTTTELPNALYRIYQQLAGIIFPEAVIVFILISCLVFFNLFRFRKQLFAKENRLGIILILGWILIPFVGFSVHAAPGVAYFPLIYTPVCILTALTFYNLSKVSKGFTFLFFAVVSFNAYFLIKNNYYITSEEGMQSLPPANYSYGYAFTLHNDIAKKIVEDAKGKKINLKGGGFIGTLETGIDDFKYLVWYNGGLLDKDANLTYKIYEGNKDITNSSRIIFHNKYLYLTKDEN